MNQDIFTFIIVSAALLYAIYSSIRALKPGRSSPCEECGGCTAKGDLQVCLTKKNNNDVTGKRLSQF